MDKESVVESRRRFGLKLQDLRESQGISLEGLAQTTRISQPFIKALEDGEFEKLPGQVFGRGFVRSLIKTMGADEKEWTADYNEACGQALGPDLLGKGLYSRGSSPSYGALASGHTITNHIGSYRKESGLSKNFSSSFPRSPRGPKSRRGSRNSRNSRYSRNSRALRSLTRFFPYWVAGPLVGLLVLGMIAMTVAILGKIGFDQPIAQFWSSLRSAPSGRQASLVPPKDLKSQIARSHLSEVTGTPFLYREIQEFWLPHASSKWIELGHPIPMLPDPWPTDLLLTLPQEYRGPMDSPIGSGWGGTLPFGALGDSLGGQDQARLLQSLGHGEGNRFEPRPSFEAGPKDNGSLLPGSTGSIGSTGVATDVPGGTHENIFQNGAQEITLVVVEAGKIKLGLDGSPMKIIELKPETYRFHFKDRADFLAYDAGSLSIRYNGKDLGTLGQKGRIRRLTFKAEQEPIAVE